MDLREAAYRLGISERTLRQWIKDGKLVATMTVTEHGRQWEIPESVLKDVNGHHTNGQAPEVFPKPSGAAAEASGSTQAGPSGRPGGVAETAVCENCLWLRSQIEAQNQQIHELHGLLQQAQAALPAPRDNRAWWRFWQRQGRT
jgi:excisionase family DNA binding protein